MNLSGGQPLLDDAYAVVEWANDIKLHVFSGGARGGGQGGQIPPPQNYFLPPHFAPLSS